MVAIATPGFSFAVVELKICEICGRSFFRRADSPGVYCAPCEQKENSPKETGIFEMIQEDEMNENPRSPVPASPAAMFPATRTCAHPGCKTRLGANNTQGKCQQHRSHTKSRGTPPEKTNGHAAAMKTNGLDPHVAARPHNATGARPQLVAERAKRLLADPDLARAIWEKIPNDDKAALCAAWLSGQN